MLRYDTIINENICPREEMDDNKSKAIEVMEANNDELHSRLVC